MSQIFVAGIENRVPVVGALVVTMTSVDPLVLTPAWLTCPGALCAEDGLMFQGVTVGYGPLVGRLRPPRLPWVQRGTPAAARRIIAEQIAAAPRDVSGPVDVLEMTAAGTRWVGREQESRCGL